MTKIGQDRIRIEELDLLRGIAIILMITGHSILVHPIDFTAIPWCQSLHNWIYSFHMELFFLISGAVYHCERYGTYLIKKTDRLLVPLIAVGLLNILMTSIGGKVVHEQTSFLSAVGNLFLYGDPYWFLYTLFLISAIYPLIDKICPNTWWEFGFVVFLIVIPDFVTLPKLFRINSVVYYLPYFFFGRVLVKYMKRDIRPGMSLFLILMCIILYFILIRCDWQLRELKYIKAFSMMITFFLIVKMMLKKENTIQVIGGINNFLRQASTYSLQVYMFNGFILVAIRTLLVNIMHVTNPIVVIPLIVASNFLITLPLSKYLLSRTKWIAWLCGLKAYPKQRTSVV